jgi:hypothetical protein
LEFLLRFVLVPNEHTEKQYRELRSQHYFCGVSDFGWSLGLSPGLVEHVAQPDELMHTIKSTTMTASNLISAAHVIASALFAVPLIVSSPHFGLSRLLKVDRRVNLQEFLSR